MVNDSTIVLDFETYSDVSISKGVYPYTSSKNFKITSTSFHHKGTLYHLPIGCERNLIDFVKENNIETIVAHNSDFERAVFESIECSEAERYNWFCTSKLARFLSYRKSSLEYLCVRFGFGSKKEIDKKLINNSMENATQEDLNTLYEYNKSDVELTQKLYVKLLGVYNMLYSMHGRNDLGVYDFYIEASKKMVSPIKIDTDLFYPMYDNFINLFSKEKERLEDKWGFSVTSAQQCKEYLKKIGIEITSITSLEKFTDTPKVKELLYDRELLCCASYGKLKRMKEKEHGGSIYDNFETFGSKTGRFAGRGVQFHNIKRHTGGVDTDKMLKTFSGSKSLEKSLDELEIDLPSFVTNSLPGLVLPTDSESVIVKLDFSSIELRIGYWLAGDEEMLVRFRNKEDVYKFYAYKIWGIDKEKEEITKNSIHRQSAKEILLGCTYGLSPNGLKANLSNKWGFDLSLEVCKGLHKQWKEDSKLLTKIWYNFDDLVKILALALSPNIEVEANTIFEGLKTRIKYSGDFWHRLLSEKKNLAMELKNSLDNANANGIVNSRFPYCRMFGIDLVSRKTLSVRLPSGRRLNYTDLDLRMDNYNNYELYCKETAGDGAYSYKDSLKGTKVFENVCQAICYDFLVFFSHKLIEKHPEWKILFTIHDDVTFCVPKKDIAKIDESLEELKSLESKGGGVPNWAGASFPFDFEHKVLGERYTRG